MSNFRLSDYFNACQENLLNNCIECGKCVDSCLAMKYIPDAPASAEIMRGIKEFLKGGELCP
jgi:ferredoxin